MSPQIQPSTDSSKKVSMNSSGSKGLSFLFCLEAIVWSLYSLLAASQFIENSTGNSYPNQPTSLAAQFLVFTVSGFLALSAFWGTRHCLGLCHRSFSKWLFPSSSPMLWGFFSCLRLLLGVPLAGVILFLAYLGAAW